MLYHCIGERFGAPASSFCMLWPLKTATWCLSMAVWLGSALLPPDITPAELSSDGTVRMHLETNAGTADFSIRRNIGSCSMTSCMPRLPGGAELQLLILAANETSSLLKGFFQVANAEPDSSRVSAMPLLLIQAGEPAVAGKTDETNTAPAAAVRDAPALASQVNPGLLDKAQRAASTDTRIRKFIRSTPASTGVLRQSTEEQPDRSTEICR